MAINLNDSLYGAQFSAFCSLANDSKLSQDSLISVDEAGRGKGLLDQDGERRTIVVKKGDTIRPLFGRSQGHVDLNNEVRNLFKETVLRICGAKDLNSLPKSVQDVMKKGDYDNEGHPLSIRRIRAVTSAIVAEAEKEARTAAPQEKNTVVEIEEAPADDVSEIDDASEEAAFKYATPDYAAGLPPETEEMFMEFYCDAVDQSAENGQTKETCDETLREMFRTVGYGKDDRKLLAELLANGKPRFLEENGAMPLQYDGIRFAEKFKAILDKTKEYRAKIKPDGNILADTILATLKTSDRMLDVDDLPYIDADTCRQISEVAKKIDTSELLAPPPGKGHSAKSLNKKLDNFRRQAAAKFADELLSTNDSQIAMTLKQNLLMNMALVHAGPQKDSFAEDVDLYSDDLADKYGKKDLLIEIAPGLGINANAVPEPEI